MDKSQREQSLLQLFDAGVEAVGGYQATSRALQNVQFTSPVHLVAVGKAADAMAQGALLELGDVLVSGLVITKHDHLSKALQDENRLECIESGHPVPDEFSLQAGQRMYEFVGSVPSDHQLVFLVSGGASALVEHLDNGLSLTELSSLTDKLLASGAAIGEMNQQRRKVSLIKGGKLSNVVKCDVLQLLISDVPGDVPGDIGSGLLSPDEATGMGSHLPIWQKITTHIIASSAIAQSAVVSAALEQALPVMQSEGSLNGDIQQVSSMVAARLFQAGKGVYVWGGEPTVVLPDTPGRGGRNQHLALSLAKLAAEHGNVSILVCGTDGTDGPTTDAGGLVDESTVQMADNLNLDIDQFLSNADSGTALAELGQLVTTGPTGTNVMDLCIAIVG